LTMRRRIRTNLLARALTITSLAAVGVLAVPLTASAAVGNPGTITLSVTGGSLRLGLLPFGLPAGSMSGQIDSAGAISIPQSSLELTNQPFTSSQATIVGTLDVSGTVTVDTTSLSGTLNPVTGAASLTTSIFASATFTISLN